MADFERNRDWDRDRRDMSDRDWDRNRQNRFRDERLDDRTGSGPGSSGGYRADQYYQGNDRDYGRDDDRSSTYGGFEDRSFSDRERGDRFGQSMSGSGRSQGAREYQTNYDPGMRGNADSAGYGGRYDPERSRRESYPFQPYQGYSGISSEFGMDNISGPYRARGDRHDRDHGRGFWSKASDRVSSWMGDDEAKARLREDHSGKGPKGYKRSDDRIREDVSDRLTDDAWLNASDIEVTVMETEVTLTGTVDSRDAKRRAEHIAESVSAVSHVQNNLRVSQASQTTGATGDSLTDNAALTKQAQGRA